MHAQLSTAQRPSRRMNRTTAVWTPVAPASTIKKNHGTGKHPLKVSLHGFKNVSVFWDDEADTARVVSDVCSHRGASLSVGTVSGKGCVTCLYHGKKTKARGKDTYVENNIVWYNDTSLDDVESEKHSSWEFGTDQRMFTYQREFPGCNSLYMQENTLDWLHLEFIHAFSFINGRPEVVIHDKSRASYIYDTTLPDTVLEVENEFWPWNTCLRFKFGPKDGEREQAFTLHFAFVPQGLDNTSIIVRVTRSKLKWLGALGDAALLLSNELPLIEDRDIVQTIPHGREWREDKLGREDAFLSQFRTFVAEQFPKTAEFYAGYVEKNV